VCELESIDASPMISSRRVLGSRSGHRDELRRRFVKEGVKVIAVKWSATAACAAAIGMALAGCGSGHKSGAPTRTSYVTVPIRAQQTDILSAYGILHRLGLRVELTRQTGIASLTVPFVLKLAPHAGTRVPRGSTIKITPRFGPIGSPAVMKSHPHYRVPSFIGRSPSDAIRWVDQHYMFWAIPKLPALPASRAQHLLDAYRIVAQQPKPGGTIVQGVMIGPGFKPTPLTLIVVRK